jgi:uncharacterized protein YjbI with pentapeptide repeats
MKSIIVILAIFVIPFISYSQAPQFAVVRPNGTTFICPSFDSAYNKAVDDDFIYLPGTVISGDKTISKRLTMFGTGHYSDSTIYTGKTVFAGNIYLEKKCNLEGFDVPNYITITNSNASGSSFIRIRAGVLILSGANNIYFDGAICQNITGSSSLGSNVCVQSSNVFFKNCIMGNVEKLEYANFKNCIFLGATGSSTYLKIANTTFSNCFFKGWFGIDWYYQTTCFPLVGNTSNNCLWTTGIAIVGQNNFLTTQPDTVLVNSGGNGNGFDYSYNYHLKSNSPYLTAGDDGTQIGIYGGVSPYKEGAVPSNPHIYFKQVASTTNNNGQLQIQFKVRTGN